jgi:hypothetical protein
MALAQAASIRPAVAADVPTNDDHIRTTDPTLRAALDDGLAHSNTFQSLVVTLEASDVVAYVVYDWKTSNVMAAHISFLSMAGGRRYVTIGLLAHLPRIQKVAILAHELQHAVEVASTPSIVDAASMARYYAGLKYGGVVDASRQHRFESRAAIDTEARVAREMSPRAASRRDSAGRRSAN